MATVPRWFMSQYEADLEARTRPSTRTTSSARGVRRVGRFVGLRAGVGRTLAGSWSDPTPGAPATIKASINHESSVDLGFLTLARRWDRDYEGQPEMHVARTYVAFWFFG